MVCLENLETTTNIHRPDGMPKTKSEVIYDLVVSGFSSRYNTSEILQFANDLYNRLVESGVIQENYRG